MRSAQAQPNKISVMSYNFDDTTIPGFIGTLSRNLRPSSVASRRIAMVEHKAPVLAGAVGEIEM